MICKWFGHSWDEINYTIMEVKLGSEGNSSKIESHQYERCTVCREVQE